MELIYVAGASFIVSTGTVDNGEDRSAWDLKLGGN